MKKIIGRTYQAFKRVAQRGYDSVKGGVAKVGAAGAGTLALTGIAHADGTDPGVAAITALSSTATTYIAAAFAVAVLVAGGFWGISMMKKAFSKAK
ncbi:major coat protein [Glaciimonas sp. PCH181]|uniref:major coat protein n=1 Tax=Glaciimonas sp. PCH181 TaxID=2133943 RepID=UPI000D34BF08|nr:major coat protein [Glaciimonas sp. PCH181]PUA19018.1 hypothetical protein C7W93_03685 [Glaciimonas sp. PCH181]